MSVRSRLLEVGFPIAVCWIALLSVAVPFAAAAPDAGGPDVDPSAVDAESTNATTNGDHPAAAAAGFSPETAAANVSAPESDGTATVDGRTYDTIRAAISAAEPGDTVVLEGAFEERVDVRTDDVRLVAGEEGAVVDGGAEGRVLTVSGENVTVEGVWIRNSGREVGDEDAGVFVDGDDATLRSLRITESAYGIWIDDVDGVTVADVRIEGREGVYPATDRGNGIHLYSTAETTIRDSEITGVRDGIYFSWSTDVLAENNSIWNARYGVHYMYSDDNRLVDNVAADNGVGFALMVSEGLEVQNNTAIRNTDDSGHGIMAKDIEDSTIAGNVLVENRNGLFVYNAQDNAVVDNLVLANDVGIHVTAGSDGQRVTGNSFVANGEPAYTTTKSLLVWNDSAEGNYWSDARTADLDGDGVSEARHRPAGLLERLVDRHPQAAVFADSPAFEAVRLAESSFPAIESPGIVDERPTTDPRHDWRRYANTS
ncbi:MAG: nitrous oxide reductase family maturation protein NosD [Haloferacaceae archaeon]